MESAAWNIPGIIGGSSSANAFASAGDLKGKLRVKWFWLIVCPLLVHGFADSFCSGLLLRRRHLRRPEIKGQLVDFAGEAERELVTLVHRRAGIDPNVEGLVDGHHQWNRVRDLVTGQRLAIDRKYASAALAGPRPIVFEVEHDRVLAWLEPSTQEIAASDAALPAVALEIKEVVNENRLAFEQIEAKAAHAAAQSHDHSLGTACGNRHLGGDGVVLVQNTRRIAERNAGIFAHIGEHGLPGDRTRSRRKQA